MRKQQDGEEVRSSSSRGGRGAGRPDGWLENLCQVGCCVSVHAWCVRVFASLGENVSRSEHVRDYNYTGIRLLLQQVAWNYK